MPEPTNANRREWARAALDAYKAFPGLDAGDDFTTLGDLLGDLLHLADELAADADLEPAAVEVLLDRARRHHAEEREEADAALRDRELANAKGRPGALHPDEPR